MSFKPAGLITGIGSLPYTDTDQALSLIFSTMPEIPHWPQLPGKGGREGFVYQFLTPLVKTGLIRLEKYRAYFNTASDRWAEGMTEFYTFYMAAAGGDGDALEQFALPVEAAAGFYAFMDYVEKNGSTDAVYYKGHLAGPLTIGFQLKDSAGRLAYYEDQLRDLLVKTLALNGRWQASKLASLGRPAIVFIDEPGVGACGSSSYITLTREMIIKDLNEICEQIHSADALAGVHSCDAIDWSILYQSNLEIVNLDAFNYGSSLIPFARELKDFIARGGVLATGIVPTSEKAYGESPDSLMEKLQDLWQELEKRGIDRQDLLRQSMITPACGTGLLEPVLAERIYSLTRQVSQAVRELGR